MRGLHEDTLPLPLMLEPNKDKTELCKYMQMLRPDNQHVTLWYPVKKIVRFKCDTIEIFSHLYSLLPNLSAPLQLTNKRRLLTAFSSESRS